MNIINHEKTIRDHLNECVERYPAARMGSKGAQQITGERLDAIADLLKTSAGAREAAVQMLLRSALQ